MAEARLSKTYEKWALVIDEQELRRLVDECQRVLVEETNESADNVKLTFEVQFSDGLSFTPESLEDVLREENPRTRSIRGLDVFARTKGALIRCRLGLDGLRSAGLSVQSANRQWVYVAYSRVEERLRRMKQWYPRSVVIAVAAGVAAIVLSIALVVVVGRKFPGALEQRGPDGKSQPTPLTLLLLLATIVVGFGVGRFAFLLFPDLVFRIGDGIARHDQIVNRRSKLGWAIVAACVLTPIVRVLSGLLW